MRAPLWAAGPAARAQRGAAQGRSSVAPRRGAAWGCAGAQRGAVQGRSRAGRRRGAAVWGRAGARRGAAQGRSVGLRRGGEETACTLGGGGGCGLVGGCAREGDGGAVSSAAERHRVADRADERPGLAKVGRGARGARGVGGAAVNGGARTTLGGDESRRASSTGANPGGGGGERHAVPSRPNRTGTGPAGGIPGGRAGLGTGAPGPRSLVVVGRRGVDRAGLWAAAGEGERGRAGRARGLTPRGPQGLGEGCGAVVGGCAGAHHGAAYGRGADLCRGAAAWGCAWAQFGAAQGRSSVGLRKGVVCGCLWAQRGAAQGRGSVGCAGAQWRGVAHGRSGEGCAGAQQRGAARERRSVGLRRGAAAWGCEGAQHGAAHGRGSMGPCRGAAARGHAGAKQCGAAQGRSGVGLPCRVEEGVA